ncbi:hypothetical protein BDY24DRAFT_73053 [Mrakia frigida]|uniref:uncharacterized protein n=1 Tax=Mrakia frigida TaxID=29902 RepID=UPI003FCBFCBB
MSEVEEVEVSRRPVVSLFWECIVGAKEGGRGWSFVAASVGRRDGRGRRGVRGKERARADPFPFLLFFFSRWTTPFEELVDSDQREGSLPLRSPRLSSFVQMSSCRTNETKGGREGEAVSSTRRWPERSTSFCSSFLFFEARAPSLPSWTSRTHDCHLARGGVEERARDERRGVG